MFQKKSFRITALLIAVLIIFASCSKDSSAARIAAMIEQMKNTTYQVEWFFPGWEYQPDEDMVIAAFNDKLTELGFPGLTIKLNGMDWGTWGNSGDAVVLLNGDYDICYAPSWARYYQEAMQKAAWLPWDNFIDTVPEFAAYIAPYRSSMYVWGGYDTRAQHIYRMPNIKEYASYLCEAQWNKTVAEKLGITEALYNIKSLRELDPYLEMYKNVYGSNGMAVIAVDTGTLVNCFKLGGNIFQPAYNPDTDRYETGAFSPWFDEYIQTTREWYDKGYIPDYQQSELFDDLVNKFGPESFLVYFNSGKPGGESELNISALQTLGFEWGTTPLTPAFMDFDSLMGSCFAINARSENPEAAAFVFMLLNTNKDLTNLINFGIEGVHYTLDSNGVLQRIEPSRYYSNLQWMLGNRFLNHRLPGEPENLGQLYREFNNNAVRFSTFNFQFPPEAAWQGVDTDLFYGVVRSLRTYNTRFRLGIITDAEIADIRNKLNQANHQAVADVLNREYQAWKASQ